MVAEIWASVISSFADQLVALISPSLPRRNEIHDLMNIHEQFMNVHEQFMNIHELFMNGNHIWFMN